MHILAWLMQDAQAVDQLSEHQVTLLLLNVANSSMAFISKAIGNYAGMGQRSRTQLIAFAWIRRKDIQCVHAAGCRPQLRA